MKILYITNNTSVSGGANKSLVDMSKAIRACGHEILVVSPEGEAFADILAQNQIPQHIMPEISKGVTCSTVKTPRERVRNLCKKLLLPVCVPGRVEELCRLIRKEKVDLVHTNTSVSFEGAIAAKKMGIPHVWHIREFMEEDYNMTYTMPRAFMRKLFRGSDAVVCISEAINAKFSPLLDQSKTRIIYNAVSHPSFRQEDVETYDNDGKKVFLIVGAIQYGKGVHDAIKAFGNIATEAPDARLWVVGNYHTEDAYYQELQALIRQYQIEDKVKFWGAQKAVGNLIQSAYCGLMCSYMEGLGRVTIEYLMMGKPVIGAAAGGTLELIRDQQNGLLYTPGDYRELADKMKLIYQDQELAAKMGQAGKTDAGGKFDSASYAQRIITVYCQALDEAK